MPSGKKKKKFIELSALYFANNATPKLDGLQHSIRRSSIQANNFEIKLATIQLLQANGQFGGSLVEDPNNHILNFLEICDTLKHNGVSDDLIPGKTAKMRNDITSFVHFDNESLYEAWERFKDSLRRCIHHGLPKWLQGLVKAVSPFVQPCENCGESHTSEKCPLVLESVQ
ncbi:uncharacterized protein G2W53_027392 [Senna tora]|uniref:Uncharacterized protein n=1 Tax=Senna tora TaxID=362788 RepID=A0A834TGT3_9FABA|nr:uncharacterized protein G2W53_027392 [Senna tora]